MLRPGQHISWKDFFRQVKAEYQEDRIGDTAAAATYSVMLALFPFLLFLVALMGLVLTPQDAQQLVGQLGQVAPAQVTSILGGFLQNVAVNNSPGLLTVGALGTIWAAAGGVVALMRALNVVYDVEEGRPFWKVRLIALGMVFVAALLMVCAAGVAVVLPALAELVGGPALTVMTWLRLPVAGLIVMFAWAVLYYVLPDVQQKFRFLTFGSVTGTLLWLLASWGFSTYVANFGKYEKTYGTLGGVIVLLLWMYISAQVFLMGAEMNAVLEHTSPEGKREGAKRLEDAGRTPPRPEGDGGRRPGRPEEAPALALAAAPQGRGSGRRTRVGSRKKKLDKLELAFMGVVALRALRGHKRRPPTAPTVH